MKRLSWFGCAALLALAGCASEATETQSLSSESSEASKPLRVTRAQIGKEWPLSVDEGAVSCEGGKGYGALFFERDGRRFALNGTALIGNRAPDIFKSGWVKPDPRIKGSYLSIDPLQEAARSACK